MFAFPRNSQSADQQLKDEADCYGMAKQRTGINTQAPVPTGPSAEEIAAAQKQAAENAPQAKGGRAQGAARGAAGGAAIGAIAGEWQNFVSDRLREDFALVRRVAQSSSHEQIWAAYVEFWQRAVEDYGKEYITMGRLAAGVTSQSA